MMSDANLAYKCLYNSERNIFRADVPKIIRRKVDIERNELIGIYSRNAVLFIGPYKKKVIFYSIVFIFGKKIFTFAGADKAKLQLRVVVNSEQIGLSLFFAVKAGKKQGMRIFGKKTVLRKITSRK